MKIEALRASDSRVSVGRREQLSRETGIKGRSALFSRRPSLQEFRSCPIDIMHLLLINIPSLLIDLFISQEHLSSSAQRRVDTFIESFGSGVPSESRRPRRLRL